MLLIQVASISGSLHWLFCHIMHLLAWPTCEGNTYDLQSSTINGIVGIVELAVILIPWIRQSCESRALGEAGMGTSKPVA